jgi:hypothetical protein
VTVTFVLQLLAALWVAMYVGLMYLDAVGELAPSAGRRGERPAAGPRLDSDDQFAAVTVVLGVLVILQAGYAYLHYSLYAAGEAAGRTDGDRVP